jgi:chromosome partitioning protein
MASILAIANQKGGVGKTTTAISLSSALAALEKKVLLIDCDPQGNTTRGVGAHAESPNLYHVLSGEVGLEQAARRSSFPNLSVVGADRELVGVEVEFVQLEGWESRLARAIRAAAHPYDVILMDCPPSLGHLTVSALAAADGVLVPLQCEYFALEGVSELLTTIRRIQSRTNPRLGIAGILLTMYDERTNLSKEVADEVRRHCGDKVFRTIIPRNVRLAEAPSHGMPILEYDIKSRGAEAYLALARELLRRST